MPTVAPSQREVFLSALKPMPMPGEVLMCPPENFDVIDVKNPFMAGQAGKVDRALARRQWSEVMRALDQVGARVRTLAPLEGCEDMVFCASAVFMGLDIDGRPVCVPGQMRYPSRQREVAAHIEWCEANGIRVVKRRVHGLFEGGGDAIWHPGRRMIWGGYGIRTSKVVYDEISDIFDAPVILLELATEQFYHLSTCFCPVDEHTVLVYPPAITPPGMGLIRDVFERVVEADAYEATTMLACNAAAFGGKHVVIQGGAVRTNWALRDLGFEVVEVETSEFLKSGGSAGCIKALLF
jgi:N-dimethylarginine dimethylaminohydrolase